MGSMTAVTCPNCGYTTTVFGAGGDVSMKGFVLTTRICDGEHELVDCGTTEPVWDRPEDAALTEQPCEL